MHSKLAPVLLTVLFVTPCAAHQVRDVSKAAPVKGSIERTSECIAFIEGVRTYHTVLRGLPQAIGQDVSDVSPQLEWVWTEQTRKTVEAAQAEGAMVDHKLASHYVKSFGPVGGHTLLLNRPEYINNVRLCRDVMKAQYE